MEKLVKLLNEYTKAYDEGNPLISDKEWDDLYFKLVEMEKEAGYSLPCSPTQKINYQVVNELKKVEHNHPMLSLNKTKDIEELKKFVGDKEYVAMAKMDGLTCSLKYIDGKLVSAETRGNGLVGEDITHNAMVISSIPRYIEAAGEFIVDGEIICQKIDFANHFAQDYKNPRNFAAGSIRLLDSKECAKRMLKFIPWDIIKSDKEFKFLSEKLEYLTTLGFTTVLYSVKSDVDDIGYSINAIRTFAEDYYPIDGIVVKYNDCEYYNSLGATEHHFRGGIAFKFYDEEYETELLDIEWTMGRTGVLTPVAVFEPIEIDGATIERASLHNLDIMEELSGGFERIGDILYIYRANQIIPQVSKWEHVGDYSEDKHLNIPTQCPICGGNTEIHESIGGTRELLCMNPLCEGKFINRLDHFCSKKGLDIKGLSKATLEKLSDWGWVGNLEELYNLENFKEEWINKPGFGTASVERVLNAINASKYNTLEAFITAIGIPLVGNAVAKDICSFVDDYMDFRQKVKSKYDWTQHEGFGYNKSDAINNFDYSEADRVYNYLVLTNTKEEKGTSLNDKTFCITGRLKTFKNRAELVDFIEKNGGKVVGSISKNVDYLINNDKESTSSKNLAAKNLKVPIITEEEVKNFLTF